MNNITSIEISTNKNFFKRLLAKISFLNFNEYRGVLRQDFDKTIQRRKPQLYRSIYGTKVGLSQDG